MVLIANHAKLEVISLVRSQDTDHRARTCPVSLRNKSDVKRRNTLDCLDQYAAPNSVVNTLVIDTQTHTHRTHTHASTHAHSQPVRPWQRKYPPKLASGKNSVDIIKSRERDYSTISSYHPLIKDQYIMQIFNVSFVVSFKKLLNKPSNCRWLEMICHPCDVTGNISRNNNIMDMQMPEIMRVRCRPKSLRPWVGVQGSFCVCAQPKEDGVIL